MNRKKLSPSEPIQVIEPDGADIIVRWGDGRTGDHGEFQMSGGLSTTLDRARSTVSVWATEAALPGGTYDPSVCVEGRFFRLGMSRAQAEGLRDRLVAEFKRHRRKKVIPS
jgi:hypothetical protein